MPPTTLSHAELEARSYLNLDKARRTAAKKSGYDSASTRERLSQQCRDRLGKTPYPWQLDVTEALTLGLDSVAIAKTGAGKTVPFMMMLMPDKKKKAIIISPLKSLQEEQASRMQAAEISAVAVNGDTFDEKMEKQLKSGSHQGIFASPEMCLKHVQFRQHLTSSNFKDICAVIVDEAHCITEWGGDFRPEYSELSKLRAFFPPHIPFLATSATLPPRALQEVRASLGIDASESFFLNLGNDRPNISYHVHQINNTTDFTPLKPHLTRHGSASTPDDLIKTIVFTNTVQASQIGAREVRSWFPRHLHKYIQFVNARRSRQSRRWVMKRFRQGKICILIATEAAGMGADIPDIEQVIQFGIPSSLSVWMQRAGRAGRSPNLNARALLLVEKSMFERIRKPKKRPKASNDQEPHTEPDAVDPQDDEEFKWRKHVEESLRLWIETTGCRRDVADEYFNNPKNREAPTNICCDNCSDERPTTPELVDSSSSPPSTPSKSLNTNGKRSMMLDATGEESGPSSRGGERLKEAKAALVRWRFQLKQTRYTPGLLTAAALLPDAALNKLASATDIRTTDDIVNAVSWVYAKRHGVEVLQVLADVDHRHEVARQHAQQVKAFERQLKQQEKQQRDALEREEKQRQKALEKEERQRKQEAEKAQKAAEREAKRQAAAAAKAAKQALSTRKLVITSNHTGHTAHSLF